MIKHLVILTFLVIVSRQGAAAAAKCAECSELHALAKQYKQQMAAEKPAYHLLEAKAVTVVHKMTAHSKSPKLSSEQLEAYFEVLRYATPVDPGAIFIEDTIGVIRANRKEIDLKLKKLPAREASLLEDRIEAYTANAESGPD